MPQDELEQLLRRADAAAPAPPLPADLPTRVRHRLARRRQRKAVGAVLGIMLIAGLAITVDCGIGSVEEVAAARAAGIQVVVTDHHEPGEPLRAQLLARRRPRAALGSMDALLVAPAQLRRQIFELAIEQHFVLRP